MKISDHVVLRYMQRRLGVDVDAVRREILATVNTRRTRRFLAFAGEAPWRVRADGMVYCVREGTVTTCYVGSDRFSPERKRRASRHGGEGGRVAVQSRAGMVAEATSRGQGRR